MTYDSGDGQLAGKIHREISVGSTSEAAVAAKAKPEFVPSSGSSTETGPRPKAAPEPEPIVREPVPNAAQLATAQDKLKKVYAEQLREAKYDDSKRALVKEFVRQAGIMDDDPAGAYALQTASLRMSVDAGGTDEMIMTVDQRVGRFEVDAYEENMKWMLSFGEDWPVETPQPSRANPTYDAQQTSSILR